MKTSLTIIFAFLLSTPVFGSDFYVITETHKSQSEAQAKAAELGGWVLITNFYKKLTPDLFAVVRGPFQSQKLAEKELAFLKKSLKKGSPYSGAYLKDAGEITLNANIGGKDITPQVIAALLGEVRISSSNKAGGSNPCEPEGAYRQFSLHYFSIDRGISASGKETSKPKEMGLDIGSFNKIGDTGEIDRMRVCAE